MATKISKKSCSRCRKNLPMTKFYNSTSQLCPDGKMNICKDCLKQMVDVESYDSVKSVLRQIDKPWIPEVWEKSKQSNNHPFGEYLKNVNSLPQYRDLTWQDNSSNENASQKQSVPQVQFSVIPELNFTVTPDMVMRWGTGYDPEDYMYLENMWDDMMHSYEIETASHKDYTKKICKMSLNIEKADRNNDITTLSKLIPMYDKLMHSAKFTAVQRTASDKTGGFNSFGEWFALAEKEGFIPRWHNGEPQDIVDLTMEEYKKYLRELVLGDPTIAQLVDAQLQKIAEKGDVDVDEDEVLDDDAELEDSPVDDDSEWNGDLEDDEN